MRYASLFFAIMCSLSVSWPAASVAPEPLQQSVDVPSASQATDSEKTAVETIAESEAATTIAEPEENTAVTDRAARLKVTETAGSPNPSSMTLMKIVISLALVVVLVIGLGWLFKKLSLRLPGTKHIKVISSLPLGQRERILVIEMQGKQRVIGVTPHNINLLFELENPLPEEKLASDFHTQLQSFLKK